MFRLPDLIGYPTNFLAHLLVDLLERDKRLLEEHKAQMANKNYGQAAFEFDQELIDAGALDQKDVCTVEDLKQAAESLVGSAANMKLADESFAEELRGHISAMQELLGYILTHNEPAILNLLKREIQERNEHAAHRTPVPSNTEFVKMERRLNQRFQDQTDFLQLISRMISAK